MEYLVIVSSVYFFTGARSQMIAFARGYFLQSSILKIPWEPPKSIIWRVVSGRVILAVTSFAESLARSIIARLKISHSYSEKFSRLTASGFPLIIVSSRLEKEL